MKSSYFIYPSLPLSQYVKYYWILRTNETESMSIQTIPSGCMHLVFHRGGNLLLSSGKPQPKCFVRGQFSVPGSLSPEGEIDMIAVILHPLAAKLFSSYPMNEFCNQYIPVEDLENRELNHLVRTVRDEADVYKCIRQIELFLQKRLMADNYNSKRIANSIQLIVNHPQVKIDSLADNACLGYRHFKRIFTEHVGMNPKEYYRVIRFQRLLYILQQRPDMEITQLAYLCGFADHSHLVKDFKSFTGVSPTQYLLSRSPYSTFFSNDCRLNLIKKH